MTQQPAGGSATLVVRGAAGERRHELQPGLTHVIGRDAGCTIVIDVPFLSRRQAELVPAGDGWTLRQLGQANPTLLRGEPITEVQLTAGDLLEIRGPDGSTVTMQLELAAAEPDPVTLDVSPATAGVSPGAQALFTVTLENHTQQDQAPSFEVTGLPPGWARLDIDQELRVQPGERRTGTLVVTVPADAASGQTAFRVTGWAGSLNAVAACSVEVLGAEATAASAAAPSVPGVTVSPATLVVERGGVEEFLNIVIRNVGGSEHEYVLTLEGMPPGWYTLPSRLRVPGGQTLESELRIRPPSEAQTGPQSFTVRVTSAVAPEVAGVAEVQMNIVPPGEGAGGAARGRSGRRATGGMQMPEVSLQPVSEFQFKPGQTSISAQIHVKNPSRLVEAYEISIEGIPASWYTQPADIRLDPDSERDVVLPLHPRPDAEHPAGTYGFRVRVAPTGYPQAAREIGGRIVVESDQTFTATLEPMSQRGRQGSYRVALRNGGNTRTAVRVREVEARWLKLRYSPPGQLQPGEEQHMRILAGARARNRLIGPPKTWEFRLEFLTGGPDTAPVPINGRFTHTPFLWGRSLYAAGIVVGVIAALFIFIFARGTVTCLVQDCGAQIVVSHPIEQQLSFSANVTELSETVEIRITNTGRNTLSVGEPTLEHDDRGFDVSGGSCTDVSRELDAPVRECIVTVRFQPLASGDVTTTLTLSHNGGDDLVWTLGGVGQSAALTVVDAVDYGEIEPEKQRTETITLSNGGNVALNISSIVFEENELERFQGALNLCEGPLEAGASCDIDVTFAPRAASDREQIASINITFAPENDSTLQSRSIALSGKTPKWAFVTGPGLQTDRAGTLQFNQVAGGGSKQLTLRVLNDGSDVLTVLATQAGAPFLASTGCVGSDLTGGGRACTLTVTFTPQAVGPAQALLLIEHTGANSPIAITLTGGCSGACAPATPPPQDGG